MSVQDVLHAHILGGLQWPSGRKLNSVAPLLPSMLMSLCTCHQIAAKALSEANMHSPVRVLLDCCNCYGFATVMICSLQDAVLPCPALPCPALPSPAPPCPVPPCSTLSFLPARAQCTAPKVLLALWGPSLICPPSVISTPAQVD